jgi:RNA polymerase sigma-70 factor (ECF subfamily)
MFHGQVKEQQARAQRKEPTSRLSLSELATAARRGDLRASKALWARCAAVAKNVAQRWARNAVDVEDLSQEALLRAVESFSALRDPTALVSWLQVVVRRSVTLGARRVRRKRSLFSGGSDPEFLASQEAMPDVQVDVQRLLTTLEGLPEEERRCLWLRRGEGLAIDEIAKETALSPSTIQRRLHEAERRLVKRLQG